MRIGVCTTYDNWHTVAEAGYDYIETNFSKIVKATEEQFAEMKSVLSGCGLRVEAVNGFFPGDFTLYSRDHFDEVRKSVYEYCEKGFSRASELGLEVAVIGSSKARNIREDQTREAAEEQFCEVLRICGEVAARYGVTVTVEPLNASETNFIITFAEGLEIAKRTGHPNVLAMVDLYHHAVNREPLSTFDGTEGILVHAHVARFLDRTAPTLADALDLDPKIEYLKETGYNGRLSLECKHVPDFETSVRNAYGLLSRYR